MKEAGADIIVAVPHSGLTGSDADLPFQENATWQIAQVDGIDASCLVTTTTTSLQRLASMTVWKV